MGAVSASLFEVGEQAFDLPIGVAEKRADARRDHEVFVRDVHHIDGYAHQSGSDVRALFGQTPRDVEAARICSELVIERFLSRR